METLRGIFPTQEPPPRRDFMKENMMRIRRMQESRRSSAVSTNKPCRARRSNYCESAKCKSRLSVEASRPPMTNLRKSASLASILRDDSTQTTDINDDMFLKDVIIRFPSASLIRRAHSSKPSTVQSQTQTPLQSQATKEAENPKLPYQNHFNGSKEQLNTDKTDSHITDLSEFLEKTLISKKVSRPNSSILKSPSTNFTNVKSKSVLLNESLNNSRNPDSKSHANGNGDVIVLSDEDESKKSAEKNEKNEKPLCNGNQNKDDKEIVDDPDCPEGHVPLTESERQEALSIAKKRFKVLVDELNRLPMTCETLRVRNRKIAIEKELRKLDENIICFSRSKVYIKVE